MTYSANSGPNLSAPVCPRHPDRITYVRCQRCGRPVCPECARAAAVGVQCVDCVRETSVMGYAGDSQLSARRRAAVAQNARPYVTIVLIVLTVISYGAQLLTNGNWTAELLFAPAIAEDQWWRFLTVALLHGSLIHLGFNMWALWVVGPFLERMLGRSRFLALYVVSALGGSAIMVVLLPWDPALWIQGTVGASGAVFGLFGAVVLGLRHLGASARSMLVVIGINLVFSFVVAGIAWQAHLGGLVIGAALGAVYVFLPARRQRYGSILATAAMVLLLIGLTMISYANFGA